MSRSKAFDSDGVEFSKPLSKEQAEIWAEFINLCGYGARVAEGTEGYGILLGELGDVTIWTERDFRMWIKYGHSWLEENFWNHETKKWNKRRKQLDK